MAFWANNELSPPESVVAVHSSMLEHEGTLYYDLNHYPYTVSAYMPIFYFLEAALIGAAVPAFAAGRLISLAAFLGLIVMAGRCVELYTGSRMHRWIATVLIAISPLPLYWGMVGQVDVLAIFFSVSAFYQFSRYQILGKRTLWLAAGFAGLALFTKQTMIAAPLAICVTLYLHDWKQAARFAAALGGSLVAAVWAVNWLTHGRFIQNTVLANLNPFSGEKLLAQLQYFLGVAGPLLLVALVALPCLRRAKLFAPIAYLGTAAFVFLATAPKVGSDTNYALEISVVLVLCATIGVYKLDFLNLWFAGSKKPVTLLLLPLAVHVLVGARVMANATLARVATEQVFRTEVAELRPFVPADGGLVLSTDFNAMVKLRQRMDVEPLIYGILVDAAVVDPEPVRRDLERQAFSTVVLHEDLFRPTESRGAEIASLPPSQREAIRAHYRLIKNIPGPFLNGIYVYQPEAGK
ncbi:MAG: hypothetical protein ABI995_13460 [Acidobacteriota bacterium]